MTPVEMFQDGTYEEICTFLSHFSISGKMPKELYSKFSYNKNGLSSGESQLLVMASKIWYTIKLKLPMLLLDEPERNIDIDSTYKMFDFIMSSYNGTIFLVTHLPDLKQYLNNKKYVKQIWHYEPHINNTDDLTFTVENKN